MKKHILLAGEKRENQLSISLILESINNKVTLCSQNANLPEEIERLQDMNESVDLIIFGTEFNDEQLMNIFNGFWKNKFDIPFVIISDTNRFNMINELLDRGYYGYLATSSDPVILVEQVNAIFQNIHKYRKTNEQNIAG